VLAQHRLHRELEIVHLLIGHVETRRKRRDDEAGRLQKAALAGQGEGDRVAREDSITSFVNV
jgi:hypothetical protein